MKAFENEMYHLKTAEYLLSDCAFFLCKSKLNIYLSRNFKNTKRISMMAYQTWQIEDMGRWSLPRLKMYMVKYFCLFVVLSALMSCDNGNPSEAEEIDSFNAQDYVLFEAGNMPLIISVAHGGDKKPEELPDRDCYDAVHVKDAFTIELALAIKEEFAELGKKPYLIINDLHRSKLDANRNKIEAACGDSNAIAVWDLFHEQIQKSRAEVQSKFQKGLYLDLHGHGNPKQRIELGYLLYEDELSLTDELLNSQSLIEVSSLQNLANNNLLGLTHVALLKGEFSL